MNKGAGSNPGLNLFYFYFCILRNTAALNLRTISAFSNLDRVMGRRRGFWLISGPHVDSEFSVDRCSSTNDMQDDATCTPRISPVRHADVEGTPKTCTQR